MFGLGLGCQTAIYRLLRNSPLKPDETSRLEAAYEQALRTLYVKDRDEHLTEMIAKKIIKGRSRDQRTRWRPLIGCLEAVVLWLSAAYSQDRTLEFGTARITCCV